MRRSHVRRAAAALLLLAACSGTTTELRQDLRELADQRPAGVGEDSERARHPLDPLTKAEMASVSAMLREAKHVSTEARFPMITLREPEKAEVLAWRPGAAFPRRAFAVIRENRKVYEAVLDLVKRKVESFAQVHGVQSSLLIEEFMSVGDIVKANEAWRAAVRKRGIESFDAISCMPLSAGHYGVPEEKGRRLVRSVCFDGRGTRNYWGRPIEGLVAIVDLDRKEVFKLVDEELVPMAQPPVDFHREATGPAREVAGSLTTSSTPGYTLDGHEVSWGAWRFHVKNDPRAGLVLSTVRYVDRGLHRSVLYQGHVSELFVPYQDPAAGWYFRTYLDAGEYGAGKLASTLVTGVDCPGRATYMGDVLADDSGVPQVRERIACLFEREAPMVAWRHYEFIHDSTETRAARELVVRAIATIGNYDYVFDWVFQQDGTIRVEVGATGVAEVKGVKSRSIRDPGGAADAAFGHFVAPGLVGVNHDHYLSYRLDFDVDGPKNTLLVDEILTQRAPKGPRKSLWATRTRTVKKESEGKLNMSMHRPTIWRVANPESTKVAGQPVSYELHPGHSAMSMLSREDFPQKRGAFSEFMLWTTAYDARERWAGGDFPNQSPGGEGLPMWTAKNRTVDQSDLVLWYTLGFHHVVRAEDWPVMPTSRHGFELRPFDFFYGNPALDLP